MTNKPSNYERLRPLIVWLGLAELAWIGYWLLPAPVADRAFTETVVIWLAAMLAWMGFVIVAGVRGFFLKHTRQFSNLLGVVGVITFSIVLFVVMPGAWSGILHATNDITEVQLSSIHILRLLSIGTVIKFLHRELPLHFVILGAFPDFLFAISALVVTTLAVGGLDPNFLIVWHLIGISIFFGAGVSMFFTMPSPFRLYRSIPDASIVFKFPMVLAPNFTVPLFMIAHLLALVKLLVS